MIEDECVNLIRLGIARNEVEHAISQICEIYKPAAKKAQWAYYEWVRRTGQTEWNLEDFFARHLGVWCSFIRNATLKVQIPSLDVPINLEKTLLVSWHSPSYPLIVDWLIRRRVLILMARRVQWLQRVDDAGCAFYFRESSQLSLTRAFKDGRPVFAMVDHCYSETRSCSSSFLSFTVNSPTGIYELAKRFCYSLCFVTWDDSKVNLLPDFNDLGNIEYLTRRVDNLIQREIIKKPESWLLWGALPDRWQKKDLEQALSRPSSSSDTEEVGRDGIGNVKFEK